jgi:6-pyruvoyltetrahydropterin/6-carboxytetrahydropterin synthase
MYSIAVQKDFIAQHFLIGGDWGEENNPHSHHYVIELIIEHDELDQHGYLVDIVDIEAGLEKTVNYFKDKMLNDLPEFQGLNPSLEHFSRIIWEQIIDQINPPGTGSLEIKLWENESCWAAYKKDYVSA